jgi:hypothetical protein
MLTLFLFDLICDYALTGFLAETPEQYALCMQIALDNYPALEGLQIAARRSTLRFSDEVFMEQIVRVVEEVCVERH